MSYGKSEIVFIHLKDFLEKKGEACFLLGEELEAISRNPNANGLSDGYKWVRDQFAIHQTHASLLVVHGLIHPLLLQLV